MTNNYNYNNITNITNYNIITKKKTFSHTDLIYLNELYNEISLKQPKEKRYK